MHKLGLAAVGEALIVEADGILVLVAAAASLTGADLLSVSER